MTTPSEQDFGASVEAKGGVFLASFPRPIPEDRLAEYHALVTPRRHLRNEDFYKDTIYVWAKKRRMLEPGERPGMIMPGHYLRLDKHHTWDWMPGESWTAEQEIEFQKTHQVSGMFRDSKEEHPNIRNDKGYHLRKASKGAAA